jgi:hypothetical protein
MRITALSRGGLAVYGGLYDAHRDEAVVQTRDGETEAVTIEYASAPTAITTLASGITTTTPAASGSKATMTLSSLQDGGYLDITATVGGEARLVRIRARSQTGVDRYEFDNDLVGT